MRGPGGSPQTFAQRTPCPTSRATLPFPSWRWRGPPPPGGRGGAAGRFPVRAGHRRPAVDGRSYDRLLRRLRAVPVLRPAVDGQVRGQGDHGPVRLPPPPQGRLPRVPSLPPPGISEGPPLLYPGAGAPDDVGVPFDRVLGKAIGDGASHAWRHVLEETTVFPVLLPLRRRGDGRLFRHRLQGQAGAPVPEVAREAQGEASQEVTRKFTGRPVRPFSFYRPCTQSRS